MKIKLKLIRITFFVEDIEKTTQYYNESLGLDFNVIKSGWSSFSDSRHFEIAFHRGKGRKPRLEFETNIALSIAREKLNADGAKLGSIKELAEKSICVGKDSNGNNIQLSSNK